MEDGERPCRADGRGPFGPDIAPLQPDEKTDGIFCLRRPPIGPLRIAAAGPALCRLTGMEPRSLPFGVLFAGDGRQAAERAAEALFEHPAILRLYVRTDGASGERGRILALPIRSGRYPDAGSGLEILGVLNMPGLATCAPARLVLERIRVKPLPDGIRQPLPQVGGFAEAPAPPFATNASGPERSPVRPRLRLVK